MFKFRRRIPIPIPRECESVTQAVRNARIVLPPTPHPWKRPVTSWPLPATRPVLPHTFHSLPDPSVSLIFEALSLPPSDAKPVDGHASRWPSNKSQTLWKIVHAPTRRDQKCSPRDGTFLPSAFSSCLRRLRPEFPHHSAALPTAPSLKEPTSQGSSWHQTWPPPHLRGCLDESRKPQGRVSRQTTALVLLGTLSQGAPSLPFPSLSFPSLPLPEWLADGCDESILMSGRG